MERMRAGRSWARTGVLVGALGLSISSCSDGGPRGAAVASSEPSMPDPAVMLPSASPASGAPLGAGPGESPPGPVALNGNGASAAAAEPGTGEPGDEGMIRCDSEALDPFSTSIAGEWDFTPQGGAPTKIQVPGGGWIKQGFTAPTATYATTITIPDSGAPQTTLLEFGAINHEATLSIDGALVGTNMTAFTPSVFDITRFVSPGQTHSIELVVRGRDALRNAAGRRLVPAAADWSPYVPQGIFRSATLRVYPEVYVSDTFVRTSVAGDSLSYDVWVTNSGTASRELTVSAELASWNCDELAYPALPTSTVSVAAGATEKVTLGPVTWGLGPSSYWWPNVPYDAEYRARLHNLQISIGDDSARIHTRAVRFGFRETEQRQVDPAHSYYFLNGVRVNFRGDSLQGVDYDSIDNGGFGDAYDTLPGFLPPSASNPGWPQAVRNYQRLSYNVVRIHQELAPPYMLDVADELGLMLIDETAIRGTDGQDFAAGRENMLSHVRAMVLRDRNHPAVIRWSQSNEQNLSPTDSVEFAGALYQAIMELDETRPISADLSGTGRSYDALVYPNFATFGHYLNGLGAFTDEVGARPDRPFGQGEFVWPHDVTREGFMWFATGTVGMRIKDASEIRPYTLLSAWASVIPGVTTTMMRLEPTYPEGVINAPLFGEDNLPDPFNHPIVSRVQRANHPVLVADAAYWEANKLSNANGDWPTNVPALPRDADVVRQLVIFNDTFAGTGVTVSWETRSETPTGALGSSGTLELDIPLGSRATRDITIHTPALGQRFHLLLRAAKNGVTLFEDSAEAFTLE